MLTSGFRPRASPQPGCQGPRLAAPHDFMIYFALVCFPLLLDILIILFESHHLFGSLCILPDVANQKGVFVSSSFFFVLHLYT